MTLDIAAEGSLRDTMLRAAADAGLPMSGLTVMSNQTDPYRIDTPANHRDAKWFANAWKSSGARRPIHLRGLHYALVSGHDELIRPDGTPYRNTADCWIWLQAVSNKARWLGYVDFSDIVDERNAPPIVLTVEQSRPCWFVDSDDEQTLSLPDFEDLLPAAELTGFKARQAYRLVFIGEKQSLAQVLAPLVTELEAELVLPTGELSTTLLHGIMKRAAEDGRPCRVFYLSDADPAGHHMPLEVSRKIQAFIDKEFDGLDIQLRRAALTIDQVKALGLPSTPLKDTERRADRWRARWGIEQTEIDALATLNPAALERIVREAVAPYWDETLPRRVEAERQRLVDEARETIARAVRKHGNLIEDVWALFDQADEAARLALNAAEPVFSDIRADVMDALPEPEIPEPKPLGDIDEPLFDSRRTWLEQTETLLAEKLSEGGGDVC